MTGSFTYDGALAFPAYAGMNRLSRGFQRNSTCVPRVCGDEP